MALGLVILGRQGSGKGTQAARVAAATGVVHISTGDMLRQAVTDGTEMGLAAKQIMDDGGLVGDDIMNNIVRDRLALDDVRSGGFLLDGYPRTPGQAEALAAAAGDSLALAINLDVPVEEVTARMVARGRDDDTPDSIARRLALYEAETSPLLAWFEARGILAVVDGIGSEDEVFARLRRLLDTVVSA